MGEVSNLGEILKSSDRVIISIIRALLRDVDLLLLNSLDTLGERSALKVLKFLRQYVHHRGLPQTTHLCMTPTVLRHSKTVIFTTKFESPRTEACTTVVARGENPTPRKVHTEAAA